MGTACLSIKASLIAHGLPSTAASTVLLQVAGQQGAYVAHLINRGFTLGPGGMDQVGCMVHGCVAAHEARKGAFACLFTMCAWWLG